MKLKHKLFLLLLTCLVLSVGFSAKTLAAPRLLRGGHRKVCSVSTATDINCFAQVVLDSAGNPAASPTVPSGYSPAQFHSAYQLPTISANPGTIGIVDAYDDPDITSDLANYDSTFGLPVFPACSKTVVKSCFTKVSQSGSTAFYPARSSSWSLEIALDVETAHQTCQNCKVILVEANSANYNDLMTAVDRARTMGATVISNSYGSSEFRGETSYDSHFNFPGIAFLFSAGDGGYGATYPAASPDVTAVGGTTLALTAANARSTETVWDDTGSGCSAYEKKPVFQVNNLCPNRTIADVAADADPNTGAAVYDTYTFGGKNGWFQVGGTSFATPLIAGIYGLANNVAANARANGLPYSNVNYGSNLFDVLTGSNGSCGNALCHAAAGYDAPSGLGSPIGMGAF